MTHPAQNAAAAAPVTLAVMHDTSYRYEAPVELAYHLAYLRPLHDDFQTLDAFSLGVSPEPVNYQESTDVFGNVRTTFALYAPHASLLVRAISQVSIKPRYAGLELAASMSWENVAQRLRYDAAASYYPEVEFVFPSPYVPIHTALRDYALTSFTPGRPLLEAAVELMHRIFVDFTYDAVQTDVSTPILEAFTLRRGVCQDFSHVMIGCLRALGLPARYASGYLMSQPPAGQARLIGADASHAWVSVHCPGTAINGGWVDLDPTNDLIPGVAHVVLAYGRDYGDVTPLRGVIRGGGHDLDVQVTVAPLAEMAALQSELAAALLASVNRVPLNKPVV